MNKNDFLKGVTEFGKGVATVVGVMGLSTLAVMSSGIEHEREEKYGESFKDVMTAITDSGLEGYYQRRIIEKVVEEELSQRQIDSIIAICETNMRSYYKYSTIMKIVD